MIDHAWSTVSKTWQPTDTLRIFTVGYKADTSWFYMTFNQNKKNQKTGKKRKKSIRNRQIGRARARKSTPEECLISKGFLKTHLSGQKIQDTDLLATQCHAIGSQGCSNKSQVACTVQVSAPN